MPSTTTIHHSEVVTSSSAVSVRTTTVTTTLSTEAHIVKGDRQVFLRVIEQVYDQSTQEITYLSRVHVEKETLLKYLRELGWIH